MTPRQVQHELATVIFEEPGFVFIGILFGLFVSTVELVFMPSGGIYIGVVLQKRISELFSAPVVKSIFGRV